MQLEKMQVNVSCDTVTRVRCTWGLWGCWGDWLIVTCCHFLRLRLWADSSAWDREPQQSNAAHTLTHTHTVRWPSPGLVRRSLLSVPIGLRGAVGGAIVWTDVFLWAVLRRKLEARFKPLPLLRGILDRQSTPFLRQKKDLLL